MRQQPTSAVVVAVLATVLSIASLFTSEVYAQGAMATGEIEGVVRDPDGAGLPGATITVRGEALIQESLTKTAGANGDYLFRALRPGSYTVTVQMPGFANEELLAPVQVAISRDRRLHARARQHRRDGCRPR